MILKNLKLIIFILIKILIFTNVSLALTNDDCRSSSFYIQNISVDLTKSSIMKARAEPELKAKLIGYK